jgi:putative flavoprotein involved in K+ transport
MRELKGYEESQDENRPMGVSHQLSKGRTSYPENRQAEQAELGYGKQPYVVVIGGGQAGIVLGARLRQLGVPALVIDKGDRPGDQWRKRYKSLCLHDPVWYDHLPYLPFPRNWPTFAPKDKIADWLEMYTRVMEVPYWNRSTVRSATYDESAKTWSVTVDRDGEAVELRPQQLVFATGMSGKMNLPTFPGMDVFQGEQQHSRSGQTHGQCAGSHPVTTKSVGPGGRAEGGRADPLPSSPAPVIRTGAARGFEPRPPACKLEADSASGVA